MKVEAFIVQRYRSGLDDLEALDGARSESAKSRATLEQYREILAQQKRALKVLLGRASDADITTSESYAPVMVPLTGLPDQTFKRRPDLMAAYLAIEAGAYRTKVAYKSYCRA
jgi:outer membrane protein TolC